MIRKTTVAVALFAIAVVTPGYSQAEGPTVDQVISDLAAIGPEVLLARVKDLKTQAANLTTQAAEMRKKAGELDAQAANLKKQIEAVEKFTTELAKAMNPAPAPAPTPATPAAAPAPAPATPAAAPETPAPAEPEK